MDKSFPPWASISFWGGLGWTLWIVRIRSRLRLQTHKALAAIPIGVGELGKAYVQGIHQGSQNRISVIAQHFPGLGSVDRPPYDEVSTIQKTLDQLEQIELAPYFSLTGDDDPQRQVDGLMISAVRFQGLQGNIRATTMPVNFDKTALEQLLSPRSHWRIGDKTVD